MSFLKAAIGTKKQKIFWVVFSICVAILGLIIIFVLMPTRVHEEMTLNAGEWAHYYPDSFWHGSVSYSFSSSGSPIASDAVAHVYNMDRHGVFLDYDMKADGLSSRIGSSGNVQGDKNWNTSLIVTDGSSISFNAAVRGPSLEVVVTGDKQTFDDWADDKSIDLSKVIDYFRDQKELSCSVTFHSVSKYTATRKVYIGVKVASGNTGIAIVDGFFYRHIARTNMTNCTNYKEGTATIEFNNRELVQIDAPEVCTSDKCVLDVVIEPRWGLFLGVVVFPVIIICIVLVFVLMAIKVFHVRQTIAMMRKKASEEGVALEEGKSKDIHQERLDEADAEGDMSEPPNSADVIDADGDADDKDKKASDDDKEEGGAAVLTTKEDN